MCMSAPKIKKPPPAPPPVNPDTLNEAGKKAEMLERQRAAARAGRASTVTAGSVAPTGQGKTALGA